MQKVIEESLKENIDGIDIKQKKKKQKNETTSTEEDEKPKGNNKNDNKLENNNNENIKKISEETINKININGNNISNINDKNDKNFKASENPSDDESPNEPLKYKISSLQKDIRSFYKFKGFLGEGHFGSVRTAFKKREYSPHKLFAVKSIALKRLTEKEYQDLILEVKIISSLEHPHIVKFYETYHDQKYFHIVTELCRGNNLYMRLKKLKGRMKEEHVKIIILKILH